MDAPLLFATATPGPEGHVSDELRGKIWATLRRYAGASLDIIIRVHQEQRSLDQNAYWHAMVFPPIAEFMGEDIEGCKLILMGECWGWKFSKKFERQIPVKAHTSSMTVKEGSYFTEWVIPWAVEHCDGLQIMLPNEWAAAS